MDAAKTGSFIAGLRKELGLTQKELAERLMVSDKAVSRWETGHGMPDLDNLEALSSVLGVSVAELLRGERIVEPMPVQETDTIALGGLELARELMHKRTVSNVLLGFVCGLIVLLLTMTHLASPIHLPYRDGLASVEQLGDGTLVVTSDAEQVGIDVELVGDEAYVSCYTTRLQQLMGRAGTRVAVIGAPEAIRSVHYYPGTPDDVLLYGEQEEGGVVTLPRLVYNMWLVIGIAASAIGLAAFALLRTRWYARRVLRVALVPVCFSISLVAVLWGHFGEVYNAAFYLSGICLVALALYGLATLALSRRARASLQ